LGAQSVYYFIRSNLKILSQEYAWMQIVGPLVDMDIAVESRHGRQVGDTRTWRTASGAKP